MLGITVNKNKDFDKHISKTLSWILRHGAIKLGLLIDSEGFINLNSILLTGPLKGKCTVEDIKRIVENNDKQRFAIRVNKITSEFEIRANQGHSLNVVTSLELIPITGPIETDVVHGTYRRYWNSIQKAGLSRMNRNHIHFAIGIPGDKQKVISGIRSNCEIYIYIDLIKALSSGIKFYKSANNVILSPGNENGIIEPKYFLKVIDAKTGKLMQ